MMISDLWCVVCVIYHVIGRLCAMHTYLIHLVHCKVVPRFRCPTTGEWVHVDADAPVEDEAEEVLETHWTALQAVRLVARK